MPIRQFSQADSEATQAVNGNLSKLGKVWRFSRGLKEGPLMRKVFRILKLNGDVEVRWGHSIITFGEHLVIDGEVISNVRRVLVGRF